MGSSWYEDLYDDLYDDGQDDYLSPILDDRGSAMFLDEGEHLNLAPWWAAGFTDYEALMWSSRGFTVAEALQARNAGISVERAYGWAEAGYAPDELIAGPDPDQMLLGVSTGDDGDELVITGTTLAEVLGDVALDLLAAAAEAPTVKTARRRKKVGEVLEDQLSLFEAA